MKTCSCGNDPAVLSEAVVPVCDKVQHSLMASQDGKHSFVSILRLLDLTIRVGGKEQGFVIRNKAECDRLWGEKKKQKKRAA